RGSVLARSRNHRPGRTLLRGSGHHARRPHTADAGGNRSGAGAFDHGAHLGGGSTCSALGPRRYGARRRPAPDRSPRPDPGAVPGLGRGGCAMTTAAGPEAYRTPVRPDPTAFTIMPRRHFGRWLATALILLAIGGIVRAFALGQIEWSVVAQFLTAPAILFGLVNTI